MTKTKPFYFEEIDESKVPSEILEKARGVLNYCEKKLDLPEDIKIQWIVQTSAFEGGLEHLDFMVKRLAGNSSGDKPKSQRDPDGGFLGRFSSKYLDTIFVRADIPLREIILTIAHECDHVKFYQIYHRSWIVDENQYREKHAEDFAVRILKEIGENLGKVEK